MAAIPYKCPNCGGELLFDPASQNYKCEYCGSSFAQSDLEQMKPDSAHEMNLNQEEAEDGSAVVYSCPSCGAQIVTDDTTAATFCYYCHNPVVLEGRLSGEYLPDRIIPFAFDRKEAVERFRKFIGKKHFVPRAFFDESQIEKLSGVYYPYWLYDCEGDGTLEGEGRKVRVWMNGDVEYTETSTFHFIRRGVVSMEEMTRNALRESDKALVEGVLPFQLSGAQEFKTGYLSGFLAEKRDMEKQDFEGIFAQEAQQHAERRLRDQVNGYQSVTVRNRQFHVIKEHWQYLLLPVWVLTYTGRNGKVYYYAMNGQTGTVRGVLPLDWKKLLCCSGIIGAAVTVLGLIGGYLI